MCCARGLGRVPSSKRSGRAQGTRVLPIGERTGVLNEGFTAIEAVGAMSGDRIILADHRENRLVVGNFGTGDRSGDALELRVLQYGRDSRLRWVPTMYANAESLLVLRHRSALRLVLGRQVVDSLRGPAAALGDTLARIRGPWRGLRVPIRGSAGGAPLGHELHSPLAAGDQAVLFPDGWIAIAFEFPYRVEWVTPRGRRIAGPPLPFEGVKVDEAQQRFARATYTLPGAKRASCVSRTWHREGDHGRPRNRTVHVCRNG